MTVGSVNGCSVLHETQFVCLRVDITQVLYVGGSLAPMEAARERPQFNIKPPLCAPLRIFPRSYLMKCFPQEETSTKQQGYEMRNFPPLGELTKAIEPHLPICQICCWQLHPTMWSSLTIKSLDPIILTTPHVDIPGENLRLATGGFACNCPVPELWKIEPSGQCCICINNKYTLDFLLYVK